MDFSPWAKLVIGKFRKKSRMFFPIEEMIVNFWRLFDAKFGIRKIVKILSKLFINEEPTRVINKGSDDD